ncbi:MAG: acetate--CoA ligase family protein [Candidatus Zambryskibacteria bacterium]
MDLEKFFNPESIAIIGASNDKNKIGYALMKNLLDGKKRKIYPVTLSEKEILEIPAFKSILDIPETVDLALIAVRADIVSQVLTDCGKKQIPNAIIISSGFKEIGSAGKELEEKVADIAREQNITLLGPNCFGVIDTKNDFNASFSAQKSLPSGKISFLSQSGALGSALIDWANGQGVGISKFISLGNESCLTEIEFLEYLENDPDTSAILMYLENVKNGPKFLETVGRITPKKPIVIIKAGMGSHGNLAIMSHTGALAPEASVFIAACKQAGAATVSSLRAFFHLVKVLPQVLDVSTPVQRLIILTNGGGPSVVAADLVDRSRSLSLSVLSEDMKESLRKVLPPMAAIGNPVDIIGDALAERYDKALEILSSDENTDGIIVILTPQMMTQAEETAKVLAKYKNKKKIFPIFTGGSSVQAGRDELIKSGMAYFTFPRDVVESLDYLAKDIPKIKSPYGHHGDSTESVSENGKMMEFSGALNLLSKYNISVSGKFVKDKDELYNVVNEYDGNVFAMKIISPDIVHKTDSGAVALNIKNIEEAKEAWDKMREKNKKVNIEGVLVQKMEKGREIIIGMKRNITFGPTILFGLGGILAEAIKDTALRIAPFSKEEALKMMQEIKGIKILQGMRGEPSVNFDALADIIVNLSHLALEHTEIKEIDLNPVICSENSATIVDARIMI